MSERPLSTSKPERKFDCRQVVDCTTEFLEGRLPARSRVRLERHLESCGDCRAYVQQIALVRGALVKLPGPQMPDSVHKKLRKRLIARTSGA